ncbi:MULTISPECIES: FecR family protein [Methylococcus]|uniref:FecR family protein n=1 Tax=Methylococcus capsulatus TaxID=414 RepID=A0ABZ2F658_METCP|nr:MULTISPECIES: FecR family protein [Methylococcus]MDF9393067.1 hypothetical protein [Methylococcus capsulatus]
MRHVLSTAVLATALASAAAMAGDPVASLKTTSGKVEVSRNDQVIMLTAGAPLFTGDVLRTGDASSAGISFQDGTRMSIGPGSELKIDRYRFVPIEQDYAFDVYLRKGSAAFSTGKFAKLAPEAVKVNTPQASIGIRGTKFLVRAE